MSIHALGTANPFHKSAVKVGSATLNLPTIQTSDNYPACHDVFKVIAPLTQTPSWGVYVDFSVDNSSIDVLADLVLVLGVSALTTTGGTFKRFVAGVENFIDHIEITTGDQTIEWVYPESISIRNAFLKLDEQKRRLYLASGNDTSANLVTAAASAQQFFLSIPSYYNTNGGWYLKGQATPLKLRIVMRNLTDIVVTDGTLPVASITSVSLRSVGRDFDSQATNQALIQNQVKAGNYAFRYLIPVHQPKNSLVYGTTSYSINLSSLIGTFSHIFIIVRNSSSITTALSNDPNAYIPLSTFSIKNSSGSIIPAGIAMDSSYNLTYYNNMYWSGNGADVNTGLANGSKNIYSIVFSEQP